MQSRLRRSMTLLNVGAATFMLYAVAVGCPAQADFFRELGASKIHYGLLGGIPLMVLCFQYMGALAAGAIRQRKPIVIWFTIAARLMLVPIALTPLLRPWIPDSVIITVILGLMALSGALVNFEVPLYFSWVADLTPRRVLNRYFGNRQQWMSIASLSSLMITAIFVGYSGVSSHIAYPIIIAVAIPLGLIEPILFRKTHEPPHEPSRNVKWTASLTAPFRDPRYRSFLTFSCFWNFAVMTASGFMAIYALEFLKLSVWQVTVLMSIQVAGGALLSPFWGRLADRHGHRPILLLCVLFKSGVVLSHLLVTPPYAAVILAPILVIDGAINAGLTIASNGFMLKLAPRHTRSSFVAAITGLSGLCGGISSILSGAFLDKIAGFSVHLVGRDWNHYHALFVGSVLLRLAAIPLVCRIQEPESSSHVKVLRELGEGRLLRWIVRVPVGVYETLMDVVVGPDSKRKK